MPKPALSLTPREVATLADAPKGLIEKAIEDRVLPVCVAAPGAGLRPRRLLPGHAVAYAAMMSRLDLKLSLAHKKRLARKLAALPLRAFRTARIEIAPAVEISVGRLVGDAMDRAARYGAARAEHIVEDSEIMGGTPVIRGTRMTVYSVLGRVAHGDTVDEILVENPDLSREALEAAVVYARAHPLVGRPGGRPWAKAA